MTVPRDWRRAVDPAPDPVTGRAPLAPTPAADDPDALDAEAAAWCADPASALRSGLVADLREALRRAVAQPAAGAPPLRWAREEDAHLGPYLIALSHARRVGVVSLRPWPMSADAHGGRHLWRLDHTGGESGYSRTAEAAREALERAWRRWLRAAALAPVAELRRVESDRDRLARRLDAVVAIGRGAPYRLDPDDDGPCGWTSR